ncbi:MAG: HAMP domain-containing protein [Deltaproteobacteria bacterium]|nr:HAMP domain-containing protein [Deltaproteobacteria bacterium]
MSNNILKKITSNLIETPGRIRGWLNSIFVPIWLQLSLTMTAVILLIVVTISVGVLNRQKTLLYNQTVKIGMVTLNYVVNNASIPLLENNALRLNTLIKESAKIEGILFAIIVNKKGIIEAHSDVNKIGRPYHRIANRKNVKHEAGVTHFNYAAANGDRVLLLNRPVSFMNKHLGEVYVGISIDFIEDAIHKDKLAIIWLTVIIVFFGIVIAILLGVRFSAPVLKLVAATREIADGNYQFKVELNRNDELGKLAKSFNLMIGELWVKSIMKKSFSKYVGNDVLDMILASGEKGWLKGNKNEATVIFADIRGFTAYSSAKEPEQIVEALNEYFEIASRIILKYEGFVDKFIGDAVLGVFGVPVFSEDHTERAVKACLEMQKDFKAASVGGNRLLLSIGLSVNAGMVVSGNIGSQIKMEYTVIGDTVNVASRMNAFAAAGEVIIGKSIYDKLKDRLDVIPLPPQRVKGKTEKIETYKVLAIRD